MSIYISKAKDASGKAVALEDMLLTVDMPTSAGSKMLDGYMSLFEAQAVTKLKNAGYSIAGKVNVGEFSLDIMGETSYYGAEKMQDGRYASAGCLAISDGTAESCIGLDVNGAQRRGAAVSGMVCIKPTYGIVSRYGTIPTACSGECVSVTAASAEKCAEVLFAISGHDDKDGTSLTEEKCDQAKTVQPIKKIAVLKDLVNSADEETKKLIEAFKEKCNAETVEITCDTLLCAKSVWNTLMSAELCNNVSRYDGVKFGYRTPNYKTIDELYTNSRTEAFSFNTKRTVLYGSYVLSTENYMKKYDKALRMRRVICESLEKIFAEYDAVLLPACSKTAFCPACTDEMTSYNESLYTSIASVTGLPAVVAGGVQIIGKALSDASLLKLVQDI